MHAPSGGRSTICPKIPAPLDSVVGGRARSQCSCDAGIDLPPFRAESPQTHGYHCSNVLNMATGRLLTIWHFHGNVPVTCFEVGILVGVDWSGRGKSDRWCTSTHLGVCSNEQPIPDLPPPVELSCSRLPIGSLPNAYNQKARRPRKQRLNVPLLLARSAGWLADKT